MKRSVLFYVCALLTGVMLYSCKPSDEKLQKQVETVLTTADTKVSASVKNGMATLTGVVESEEAKMAAESLVKGVKDIKTVVNNIEVKVPVVINPDDTLTTTIASALETAGYKDVKIAVKDGEVTLSGDLKRKDLQKVMQIANEAKPKKVINELKLK